MDLFYLSPNTTGGWVTFTAHLMRCLGRDARLFKIGNNTENKERPFGYGVKYRNLSLKDALRRDKPKLIVAAAKNFREATEALLNYNAFLVVHDPTELKNLPATLNPARCVVIRKVGLDMIPGAAFIRHPYVPEPGLTRTKTKRCVSTSRIDFDKNTTILLDANRILRAAGEEPIDIRGFENRLYTRFKVVPHYPEWEQSVAHYPREKHAALHLLSAATFMADMSIIKGDGGGTQYTTLEAWDAGTVPIIHSGWLRPDDDMVPGTNCLVASDGKELADLLRSRPHMDVNFEGELARHSPEIIGAAYKQLLSV